MDEVVCARSILRRKGAKLILQLTVYSILQIFLYKVPNRRVILDVSIRSHTRNGAEDRGAKATNGNDVRLLEVDVAVSILL